MAGKSKKPGSGRKRFSPYSKTEPRASRKDDYTIGRGKPPKGTQFKPGQSGNPTGRPKGTKNIKKMIYEFGQREIEVSIQGQKLKISMNEALAQKIWDIALKGNLKAVQAVCEINQEYDAKRKENTMTISELEAQKARILANAILLGGKSEEEIDRIWDETLDDPGLDRVVVAEGEDDEDDE